MAATARRPAGAATIAILAIITGLAEIAGGAILILNGAAASAFSMGKTDMLAVASAPVGLLALTLAILSIVFAMGLLLLKPYAWSLGLGVYIVNVAIAIALGIIGALINIGTPTLTILLIFILCCAIILLYLITPNVRRAFARAAETNMQISLPQENLELGVGDASKDLSQKVL